MDMEQIVSFWVRQKEDRPSWAKRKRRRLRELQVAAMQERLNE